MGVESGNSYPTKAFRRGEAMDIMSSGSTVAPIMRPAGWHSRAFRAYLIFQMEEECNMKAIFAGPSRERKKTAHGEKEKTDHALPLPPDAEQVTILSPSDPSSTSSAGAE